MADVLTDPEIAPFEQNVTLLDPDGNVVAIADVLWRELRAVLEVDSRKHHSPEEPEQKWLRTMSRHNRLERSGLSTVHYAPAVFRADPHRVRTEVEVWLRARAAELGVAYPTAEPPPGRPPFRLAPAP